MTVKIENIEFDDDKPGSAAPDGWTGDASIIDIPIEAPKAVPPERAEKTAKEKDKDAPKIPKKKPKKQKITFGVDDIQKQIIGAHMMLALWIPDVGITPESAKAEAEAIYNILEIYGMEWLEKLGPWFTLGMVVAIGELPTAQAIAAAIKKRRNVAREGQDYEQNIS